MAVVFHPEVAGGYERGISKPASLWISNANLHDTLSITAEDLWGKRQIGIWIGSFLEKRGVLPEMLFLLSSFRIQHFKRKSAIWAKLGWNFPLDCPCT
jgi:hypothetical protein